MRSKSKVTRALSVAVAFLHGSSALLNTGRSASAQSWFALVPLTSATDQGSAINQTGLTLYTESTEIDDGGFPEVVFGDGSESGEAASPFYIDSASSKLMGNQDYWGLESIYMWNSSWEGSLWSYDAQRSPDVENYVFPAFEVDADGCLQPQDKSLVWGWCPDDFGVGDKYTYLPGTVVLSDSAGTLVGLKCIALDGLKVVAASPPS